MSPDTSLDQTFNYHLMKDTLAAPSDDSELFSKIVDSPFQYRIPSALLGLGIVVLLLVNKNDGMLDRVALSDTEQAQGAVNASAKPFHDIRIPLSYEENALIKAIKTEEPQKVIDWRYMFEPAMTAQEARFNQAGAGIACSVIYPLIGARDGGCMIFSYFTEPGEIGEAHHEFMKQYSELAAQALKNNTLRRL